MPKDEPGVGIGPEDAMDHLTFANVYSFKFSAERERTEEPESFEVNVEPFHAIEDHRVDYLFVTRCEPKNAAGERVAIIEVSMVATFDVSAEADVRAWPIDTIEWLGGNVALYSAYPYIREAVQSHANRLGMPNITMDFLKRNEPLPEGLSVGSLPVSGAGPNED